MKSFTYTLSIKLDNIFTVRLHANVMQLQHTVFPRPFCLSVCLSNASSVTKQKKLVPIFLLLILF